MRKRSSKAVAWRHDLNYFKRRSPLDRWQTRLAAGAIAASLACLVAAFAWHGRELFSKGPISSSHAVFAARCESCHLPMQGRLMQAIGFRTHVPDSACQNCHAVPAHQPKTLLASLATPACGACHEEHTGSMMLAHTADRGCTGCHADLKSSHVASNIHSFTDGHPEFAPLRRGYTGGQGLKFNHQAHLQAGLQGPHGPVDLACARCHRTPAVAQQGPWRFGTATLTEAALQATPASSSDPLHPTGNRAYMAPVTYAASCHDCHTLHFEERIPAEAPHAAPAEVRAFIHEQFKAYAAQHPEVIAAELRDWAAVSPLGQTPAGAPHNLEEWIAVRSRQAERRLWYRSCNLCHSMEIHNPSPGSPAASPRHSSEGAAALPAEISSPESSTLPTIAPAAQTTRRLQHAVFSHQAHVAVSCESCHARTRISSQGSDILLPGIASCQKCHDGRSRPQGPALATGHAESGCFLCHKYHDWSLPAGSTVAPHDLEFQQIGALSPAR